MKELGFDGSTLEKLVAGAAPEAAAPPAKSEPLVAVSVKHPKG
jgi:hypothetical protein